MVHHHVMVAKDSFVVAFVKISSTHAGQYIKIFCQDFVVRMLNENVFELVLDLVGTVWLTKTNGINAVTAG